MILKAAVTRARLILHWRWHTERQRLFHVIKTLIEKQQIVGVFSHLISSRHPYLVIFDYNHFDCCTTISKSIIQFPQTNDKVWHGVTHYAYRLRKRNHSEKLTSKWIIFPCSVDIFWLWLKGRLVWDIIRLNSAIIQADKVDLKRLESKFSFFRKLKTIWNYKKSEFNSKSAHSGTKSVKHWLTKPFFPPQVFAAAFQFQKITSRKLHCTFVAFSMGIQMAFATIFMTIFFFVELRIADLWIIIL